MQKERQFLAHMTRVGSSLGVKNHTVIPSIGTLNRGPCATGYVIWSSFLTIKIRKAISRCLSKMSNNAASASSNTSSLPDHISAFRMHVSSEAFALICDISDSWWVMWNPDQTNSSITGFLFIGATEEVRDKDTLSTLDLRNLKPNMQTNSTLPILLYTVLQDSF